MLVAFSKTRKEPNPTCVKFDSQALEPIWLPTAASYLRTVSAHSVNFLTKRGGRKTGRKTRRKKKGGAPRAPTKPKGGEARTRGRRGGKEEEHF